MVALLVAAIAALALAVLIGMEIFRLRAQPSPPKRSIPRRQPHLEDRIRAAFEAPRAEHGDIFVKYTIWRRDRETRLELFAADPFAKLSAFTRSLIVRHLWRALEQFSTGSVVVVDSPPQLWSRTIDEQFVDHGVDPWRNTHLRSSGPQYVKDA